MKIYKYICYASKSKKRMSTFNAVLRCSKMNKIMNAYWNMLNRPLYFYENYEIPTNDSVINWDYRNSFNEYKKALKFYNEAKSFRYKRKNLERIKK